MKLVCNFCSYVYSLTIINLYVRVLPVTNSGQNKKKSTSNTSTEKKNEQEQPDTWEIDENTPTEQEKKE